jgi:hypothetical protein
VLFRMAYHITKNFMNEEIEWLRFVQKWIGRLSAVALCLALLFPAMAAISETQGASADTTNIVLETFENSSWQNNWDRWDRDIGSDIDFWNSSMYNTPSGTGSSAWCAQQGYSSFPLNANANNSDVMQYDTNMDAYMARSLGGIGSYTSVTLTFQYWALTGNSTTSLGNDYVWVSVSNLTNYEPRSSDRTEIWRQPASNSSGWQTVTLSIPTDSTWISFNFRSGAAVPEGGPFIGVFLDNIDVEGSHNKVLISGVGSLPSATDQRSFDVPISVSELGSELSYIELWYRINGSGSFMLYTAGGTHPSGRWASEPVPFTAPSEGRYEFFSRVADNWGNVESLKTSAERTVIVDDGAPSTMATVTGMWGNLDWYVSAASINITGWDESSGISSIMYRLDGSTWGEFTGQLTVDGDGQHVLEYYAVDRAGNAETIHTASFQVDITGPTVAFGAANGRVFSSGDLVLTFEASDAISGIGLADYSVDGSAFKSLPHYVQKLTLTDLTNGSHQIVLRVWDNAGNPTETTLNISIDPTAANTDLVSTAAPIVLTAVTLLGLIAVIIVARRRG